MSAQKFQAPAQGPELRAALVQLRPFFTRAGWFSLFASVLVLAPSGYMLEVYSRVVDSRSYGTLFWLTVVVLGAYALMELLEWARAEVMRAAAQRFDALLSTRVFDAVFAAKLRNVPGGTVQPLQDFAKVRDFLFSPALLAIMEAPVALLMAVSCWVSVAAATSAAGVPGRSRHSPWPASANWDQSSAAIARRAARWNQFRWRRRIMT